MCASTYITTKALIFMGRTDVNHELEPHKNHPHTVCLAYAHKHIPIVILCNILTANTAKHWLIFSGSLGRQCWDSDIIYLSLKYK